MPVFQKRTILDDCLLGLWTIEENEQYFTSSMRLYKDETEYLSILKGGRRLEFLSSRYLLHLMTGDDERAHCLKDEYGKPQLIGGDQYISFSHSHGIAAVIMSNANVGIDIQKIVAKIDRISHKFINDEERDYIPIHDSLIHQHILWGAKEAMYKAYGRKEVDFRKNMNVDPFFIQDKSAVFDATLEKNEVVMTFNLQAEIIDDYVLVCSRQSN